MIERPEMLAALGARVAAISDELAAIEAMLHETMDEAPPAPSMLDAIDAATRRHYGFTRHMLTHEYRKQPRAEARQLAMWLTRRLTLLSLPRIGTLYGRHHTTVLHAVRAVDDWTGDKAARRDELMNGLRAVRVGAHSSICRAAAGRAHLRFASARQEGRRA